MTQVDTRQLGFLYRLLVWEHTTDTEIKLISDVIKNKQYDTTTKMYLNTLRNKYIAISNT